LKAGITKDVQQAYRMLLNRDSKTRVVRRSITPEQAISAIATAGGISSLAHPCKEPHIPELVKLMAPRGLRAIEAYHRSHTLSQIRKFSKLAKSHALLITGGSDCHGPFEKYPASIGE